jgi:hypothetical protein
MKLGPADTDRMDYSESNYDEFSGYGERLFSSTTYEKDDAEADQIYNSVGKSLNISLCELIIKMILFR